MNPSRVRSLPSPRSAHGPWTTHVHPHDALADPLPFGMRDTSSLPVGCSGLAGRRVVAFPVELVPMIEAHLADHVQAAPDSLVFTSREGLPLRRTKFRPHWADACEKAEIVGLHFHDLRGSGATWAATAGATVRELMSRLGHATPAVALRYQHATVERDKAIADRLGAAPESPVLRSVGIGTARSKIDDHRFAFVVGDVSGRGLGAATLMAGLRYTIRAYASLAYSPAQLLEMASKEISIDSDGHFATVLVGLVDNDQHEVTMANAGHLPPLILDSEQSKFVDAPVGVPLGMGAPAYESVTIPLAPNSTLIAYTDGLVERRNESLDTGMERLRRKAASVEAPGVDDLLASIVDNLFAKHVADDDTAILAIRWLR